MGYKYPSASSVGTKIAGSEPSISGEPGLSGRAALQASSVGLVVSPQGRFQVWPRTRETGGERWSREREASSGILEDGADAPEF